MPTKGISTKVAARQVAAARHFNRFYTRWIGVLDQGLADSPFSLTEARILYELAHRESATSSATSSELVRDLGIDPGYLSRILARFAKQGLLSRTRSPSDGRERPIALTARGRKAFAGLDRASERQVSGLLEPLAPTARRGLMGAMEQIEHLLGPARIEGSDAPVVLRDPRPGDLGWVVHRHGALYAEDYGFDASFEHLVAAIVAQFAKSFDPSRERCWIAERDGQVVGSIFLVQETKEIGRLRLFYVEPSARGVGIGAKLVAACIVQARDFGYRRLTLWTQDNLVAARRIYQAAGFVLAHEQPHHAFGQDLVEQDWTLEL